MTKTVGFMKENLKNVTSFFDECSANSTMDKISLMELKMACEEIFLNCVNYAKEKNGDIEVSYTEDQCGNISVEFIDSEDMFDPTTQFNSDFDFSNPNQGMGLNIVNSIIDEVKYSRENSKNILRLIKKRNLDTSLKILEIEDNGEVMLKLTGVIDEKTAPSLNKKVLKFFRMKKINVCLDMSGIEYISGAGIRVILSLKKVSNSIRGSLKIINANDRVYEDLDFIGFTSVIKVESR